MNTEPADTGKQFRLHIGGTEPHPDWKILNIKAAENVDFVGSCADLGQFDSESISEIYASHVFEHLSFNGELQKSLAEAYRILVPGGLLRISVPDFEVLCRIFLHPSLNIEQRYYIMQMVFGGQTDTFDFHHVGLTAEFLQHFLTNAGFSRIERVEEFGLFKDCSSIRFANTLISLNMQASKA